MKYRKGYKYQLAEDYTHILQFDTEESIDLPFIELNGTELLIKKGYAWDGPSGPTVDTKNFMVGALVHDVLYQLMRMDLISQQWRKAADLELKLLCLLFGMSRFRAYYVYRAVRRFARSAAMPRNVKKVYEVK